MKAVRVGADGGVTVDEVEVPRIGPGDALVKARAAGICGSDLLDWYVRRKAGSVLGHELAGEIVALGAGARHFQVGDLVVPHHHAACMECQECIRGRFVHCARWRASRLDPGGMAELVRVPAENLERDTGRFSPDLSPEEACFTEPLATVVKAFRRGRFHHDDRLLVVGAGPAGQLAIRYARVLGAREVAVADRVPWRLSVGERSGATRLFDVSRQPLRVAAGDAGFDFVFVCPGKSSAIAEAGGRRRARRDAPRLHDARTGRSARPRRPRAVLPGGSGGSLVFVRSGRNESRPDSPGAATGCGRGSREPPLSDRRGRARPSRAPETRTAR